MGQILTADQLIKAITTFTNGVDDLTAVKSGNGLFGAVNSGLASALQSLYAHTEPTIAGAAAPLPLSVGALYSQWMLDHAPMSGGAVPTSWANPTNATSGSLGQNSPGGGRGQSILDGVASNTGPTSGTLIIYDRLAHCGGLSGNLNTAQLVNGGSLGSITRYTNAPNNFMMWECYTGVGGTTQTISVAYNNQSNVAQTSQSVPFGGATAQSAGLISLAQGDTGVLGVTSVTVSAATGTAGNFGITIGHVLYTFSFCLSGQLIANSFVNSLMPTVQSGACLAAMFLCGTTTAAPHGELFLELGEK